MIGWCLLAIAILAPVPLTPEGAENLFYGRVDHKSELIVKMRKKNKQTGYEMYEMRRRGITYKAIGEAYSVSPDVVYMRIKKYKQNFERMPNHEAMALL